MNTLLALIITFFQLATAAAAIILNRPDIISGLLVYGSPIHLVANIAELNPFIGGHQLSYLLIFSFHSFKYFFLIRAYTTEDDSPQRTAALLMEIAYLFICGYHLHH